MLHYFGKRILLSLPTLFLVALLVFVLIRLLPGDPAEVLLGEGADPASRTLLHQQLGLDKPVPLQFIIWLGRAVRGDLGNSISSGEPVTRLIGERFELTAVVVVIAVTAATFIAIGAGLLAAWRRDSVIDLTVVTAATVVLAIPSFWLGLILILIFGLQLGWLPVVGYVPFSEDAGQAAAYLVLPILTLTITESGVLVRMMRTSSLDVLRMDYITHARAKGLSEEIGRAHV